MKAGTKINPQRLKPRSVSFVANQMTIGNFFCLDYLMSNSKFSSSEFKFTIRRLASLKLSRISCLIKLFNRTELNYICHLFSYFLSYNSRLELELFDSLSSSNRIKYLNESSKKSKSRLAASIDCNYSMLNLNKRQLTPHNRNRPRAAYKPQASKRKYSMYLIRI
jgi:hypothetical protein